MRALHVFKQKKKQKLLFSKKSFFIFFYKKKLKRRPKIKIKSLKSHKNVGKTRKVFIYSIKLLSMVNGSITIKQQQKMFSFNDKVCEIEKVLC